MPCSAVSKAFSLLRMCCVLGEELKHEKRTFHLGVAPSPAQVEVVHGQESHGFGASPVALEKSSHRFRASGLLALLPVQLR